MSDDEESLGGLFGHDEEPAVVEDKEFVVDRTEWLTSGVTSEGFTPKWEKRDDATTAETTSRPYPMLPLTLYESGKHHSLWGHRIWNAAMYLSKLMDNGTIPVQHKTVLELGAGLGVPALVAHQNGARVVVTTDYPDEALLSILRKNVAANTLPLKEDGDFSHRIGTLHAMPLLWGNQEHMQACLDLLQTSQSFDIVILSDIVFNHVCHHDLLKTVAITLAKDPRAAAYCSFSHHRPYKQKEDMEFFEKAKLYGLEWEKVDEEIYPLMFPDDPGPAEIRAPVHCFRLRHKFDACGPPIDYAVVYDCVVQGTGLTECLLSAALSRHGLRVLHLDKYDSYGGIFNSLDPKSFQTFIETRFTDAIVDVDALTSTLSMQAQRKFLLDTLPSVFISKSDLISKLADNEMAKNVEFQNVDCVVRCVSSDAKYALKSVPMTRADVFASKAFAPMEMRRVMKFVKDIEARLAEEEHATSDDKTASSLSVESASPVLFRGTFGAYLKATYGLQEETIASLTLQGALRGAYDDATGQLDVGATLEWMRVYLTSIGYYEGLTPFLSVNYGCAELPQNMARVSAVWNGMFVLGRHATETYRTDRKAFVTLSNGQKIETKAVIAAEQSHPISRCVVVLSAPLFDWSELRDASPSLASLPEESQPSAKQVPIAIVAGSIDNHAVLLYQQGYSTMQAPNDTVIRYAVVHAVCVSDSVTPVQVTDYVNQLLSQRGFAVHQQSAEGEDEKSILYRASFAIRPGDAMAPIAIVSPNGTEEQVVQDHVFGVPSVLLGLDDGAYLHAADAVFQKVVRHCKGMGVDPWANCPFPGGDKANEKKAADHAAVERIPFLPPYQPKDENDDDGAQEEPEVIDVAPKE